VSKQLSFSVCFLGVLACTMVASQAKAPSGQWEHLLEGSPILAGSNGAWIVQEPKLVLAGPVEGMTFGPGPNEATLITRQRVAIAPKDLIEPYEVKPSDRGYRVNVVNLGSNAVRSIKLPSNVQGVYGQAWVSGERILSIGVQTTEDSGDLLVDVVGGGIVSTLGMPDQINVASEVPTLALLSAFDYRNQFADTTVKIIDFSSNPPRSIQAAMPKGTGRPIRLTANRTILCETPSRTRVEVSLADGSVKPSVPNEKDELDFSRQGRGRDVPRTVWADYREEPFEGLWLETLPGLRSQFRLSKEKNAFEMNEDGRRIMYIAHGAVFLSELTPIDLDAAVKALMAQAKVNAVSFAKQAGTAMLIYAADYDDLMPISGASARESVFPYIKSARILDSVVWTNVTGQNMGKIQDPSKYELGYVPGPGGRAIIYADGHVGWRADP
jgi:hypothetical protein